MAGLKLVQLEKPIRITADLELPAGAWLTFDPHASAGWHLTAHVQLPLTAIELLNDPRVRQTAPPCDRRPPARATSAGSPGARPDRVALHSSG